MRIQLETLERELRHIQHNFIIGRIDRIDRNDEKYPYTFRDMINELDMLLSIVYDIQSKISQHDSQDICEAPRRYDGRLNEYYSLAKSTRSETEPQKPYTTLDVMYMSGVRDVNGLVADTNGNVKCFYCNNNIWNNEDLEELRFNRIVLRNGHAELEGEWKTAEEFYE